MMFFTILQPIGTWILRRTLFLKAPRANGLIESQPPQKADIYLIFYILYHILYLLLAPICAHVSLSLYTLYIYIYIYATPPATYLSRRAQGLGQAATSISMHDYDIYIYILYTTLCIMCVTIPKCLMRQSFFLSVLRQIPFWHHRKLPMAATTSWQMQAIALKMYQGLKVKTSQTAWVSAYKNPE